MSTHTHEFTALWSHFGEYGHQDVHYHVCFDARCSRLLVGPGRECDGNPATHSHEQPRGGSEETPG